jgi:hypothetical protein
MFRRYRKCDNMGVSSNYIQYDRHIYNNLDLKRGVVIRDNLRILRFGPIEKPGNQPSFDSFRCSIIGSPSLPDNTTEIDVKVIYKLDDDTFGKTIKGHYSSIGDSVYISLDDFV